MIVNAMIKRIDVYRDYDIHIELNISTRRFLIGPDEQELTDNSIKRQRNNRLFITNKRLFCLSLCFSASYIGFPMP